MMSTNFAKSIVQAAVAAGERVPASERFYHETQSRRPLKTKKAEPNNSIEFPQRKILPSPRDCLALMLRRATVPKAMLSKAQAVQVKWNASQAEIAKWGRNMAALEFRAEQSKLFAGEIAVAACRTRETITEAHLEKARLLKRKLVPIGAESSAVAADIYQWLADETSNIADALEKEERALYGDQTPSDYVAAIRRMRPILAGTAAAQRENSQRPVCATNAAGTILQIIENNKQLKK